MLISFTRGRASLTNLRNPGECTMSRKYCSVRAAVKPPTSETMPKKHAIESDEWDQSRQTTLQGPPSEIQLADLESVSSFHRRCIQIHCSGWRRSRRSRAAL